MVLSMLTAAAALPSTLRLVPVGAALRLPQSGSTFAAAGAAATVGGIGTSGTGAPDTCACCHAADPDTAPGAFPTEHGTATRDRSVTREVAATGLSGWRVAPNFFSTTNMKAARRSLDPQNRSPG